MKLAHLLKAAASLLVVTALAGCFDMDMEIKVVGKDHAIATIATTVSKELIDIAEVKAGTSEFCEEGGQVVETDTTITCTETHDGTFAEVFPASDSGEPQPSIAMVGDNQAKIVFPTGTLGSQLSGDTSDEESMKMMKQMFEGHKLVIRVVGAAIVDTNMVKSEDGTSAELSIPFSDLIEGKLTLPEESYAVVQLP